MSLSDEILKRVSESYRRMRNTARYFLGSLGGFNPETDQVPVEQLVAVDRWALWRAQQLQDQVIDAYRKYEFHAIYQMIHNFCSVDMGGFYLDVVKDRMYTTPTTSHARRSGQTAMYWIVAAMARWLAPILSFTAEEIWKFLPGGNACGCAHASARGLGYCAHHAQCSLRRIGKVACDQRHRCAARCRSGYLLFACVVRCG
jgi:isoleucyl-tRNA synthetase